MALEMENLLKENQALKRRDEGSGEDVASSHNKQNEVESLGRAGRLWMTKKRGRCMTCVPLWTNTRKWPKR